MTPGTAGIHPVPPQTLKIGNFSEITQGRLTARRSDTIPQRAQTAGQKIRLSTRAFAFFAFFGYVYWGTSSGVVSLPI